VNLFRWAYLIIIFFTAQHLFARDNVLWRNLKPSKNIDMRILDDFEDRIQWELTNSLGIQSKLRFVRNTPLDRNLRNYGNDELEKMFKKEMELLADSAKIHERTISTAQNSSQELIAYFSNPGIDYQVIEIPEKDRHFVTGRPIAISMWVYGMNKKHAIYALFSNQIHEKIPVKIGDLSFNGWKRLEVPVPISVSHRNRLNRKVLEFRFDGLKIVSHPNEKAGTFSFLYDLVCVLVDTTGADYSGSNINDNWK